MTKDAIAEQGELSYARRRINFARTVFFTGRNGHFKSVGLEIVRSPSDRTIAIEPITSKGNIARCSIEIPLEQADEVTEALRELKGGKEMNEAETAFARPRSFLFLTRMGSGFFECDVYLEGEGTDAKDALINLAAGLHEAQRVSLDEAKGIERERVGERTIDELCGFFQIEPGAADGGVIFTIIDYMERPEAARF